MIIRKPNSNETEQIITLLQASLGESLVKKSAKVWNFKHVKNPFGESFVLLAEEEGVLIGVRAFMQWRWQLKDEVWTSYRAVDTSTHPAHQGKGIFTKLTMQALEEVQKVSESFVFNTPNDKSRPGYLKMGWKQVGRINVALVPIFFYFHKVLFGGKKSSNAITATQLDAICERHNYDLSVKEVLFTPKSAYYLRWRYEENPMQNYFVVSTQDWYMAMYVKKHRFFNELRVVETIGSFNKGNLNQMRQSIVRYALANRCLLISVANLDLFTFRLYGNYGPMLTFRSLTSSEKFIEKALNIHNWSYSLGDLELF